MNYAVKGIDKYYNKAKYDPQPFPIKVGDEVIVIITCKMIQGDPHDLIYSCPFENQCKIDPRYNDGEFEVRTIVQTIFDRGGGWQVMFADLTVELPMSDYGTSFWHISDLVIYDKSREINEFVSAPTLNTNCFGRSK